MVSAQPGKGVRYMPEALQLKGILVGSLSIAGAIAFALLAAFAAIRFDSEESPAWRSAGTAGPPPIQGNVTLQPDPGEDIRALTVEKRRLLEGYAWIDRDRTIARIPIERAMSIVALRAAKGKQ